jgi:hypothetical protein
MNVERLYAIALSLRGENDERNIVTSLQNLVNACQQIGQNPANTGMQQNFVTARDNFYSAVTDTQSDSFTPAWRQVLVELGGEELFGARLKQRVAEILDKNQPTLFVAYQELNGILTALRSFQDFLARMTDAFAHFEIGSEELTPGEAEIAVLIPRAAVHNKLADFANELEEVDFILNTFAEVATGHTDDLEIRSLSSSGLTISLAADPTFGAIVAAAITFVVTTYKKILEIKKLSLEIARLELPPEISEKTRQHANSFMEAEIERFCAEVTSKYPITNDKGRKNELTTKVRMSLNKMANRIDKGFNFEVRVEPPDEPPKDPKAGEAVKKAIRTIRDSAVHMQYMNLEGPPILSLPESRGNKSTDQRTAADDAKHPKKGRRHIDLEDK